MTVPCGFPPGFVDRAHSGGVPMAEGDSHHPEGSRGGPSGHVAGSERGHSSREVHPAGITAAPTDAPTFPTGSGAVRMAIFK